MRALRIARKRVPASRPGWLDRALPIALALDRALALAVALASAAAAPASAQAPSPIEVRIEGVFGNEALIGDGYASVAVTLRNLTRRTFRGRLMVRASEYQQPEERHATALDLPGGETRRVITTLFVGATGTSVEARYEADGELLGLASQGAAYAPGGRSLVLISDPPRLRANLLDLEVSVLDTRAMRSYGTTATGGERAVTVPLGVVSLDPATADPIVPDEALGWSSVAIAVASSAMLARMGAAELRALSDWAHAGGHLLIAPRSPADLRAPIVRELLGEIRPAEARLAPSPFVPDGIVIPALDCGERAFRERFGCAAPIGFGTVYVSAYDFTAPPFVDRPETRELVRSLAQRALRSSGPRLALGRGRDQLTQDYYAQTTTFSRLRAALDPNEGYRPALGLVAIVLFLYVIVVGPLNFRFVLGRNAPTLALVTTPIAAFGCALVLLGAGYLGKGVITRYRRVEIVEAIEGSALAPARAYTGLFLTRPSTIEAPSVARGRTLRIASGGGDDGSVTVHGGGGPRLTNLRGGLWETLFLRSDRIVDLGGALRFEYEGNRLVAITNGTRTELRRAFVIDEANVYAIGDVEPGATRPIPRTYVATIGAMPYWDETSDPMPAEITRQLGLDPDEDALYVRGIVRLLGSASVPSEPLLWARIDPERPPELSPSFSTEHDLRVLLMHPRPAYERLGVAAAPSTPPTGVWDAPSAPIDTALPPAVLSNSQLSGSQGDAGASAPGSVGAP